MQRHEQHDPEPKPQKPNPRDRQARWLLLVIAILLGFVVLQVIHRFIPL
jgi:hypothetical protein